MDTESPPNPPPKTRRRPPKLHLMRLENLDDRTTAARTTKQLIAQLTSDLGGDLSAAQAQLVQRAAVLGAYIEDCEAAWLQGRLSDTSAWFMGIDRQRRTLETLGLQRVARDVPDIKDLLGIRARE
jgi:hypothetical protein